MPFPAVVTAREMSQSSRLLLQQGHPTVLPPRCLTAVSSDRKMRGCPDGTPMRADRSSVKRPETKDNHK